MRTVQLIHGNGQPFKALKIQPNSKCGCGSGKKAKKCCGVTTRYFVPKVQDDEKEPEDLKTN